MIGQIIRINYECIFSNRISLVDTKTKTEFPVSSISATNQIEVDRIEL